MMRICQKIFEIFLVCSEPHAVAAQGYPVNTVIS